MSGPERGKSKEMEIKKQGRIQDFGKGGGPGNWATQREGGSSEVLPLQKKGGGAENVLAMLKGGYKMF